MHALHSLVHVQHLNQQKIMHQIADVVLKRDSVEKIVANAFATPNVTAEGTTAKAAGVWLKKIAIGSGTDELKEEQAVSAVQVTPVEDEMRI